MHNVRVEPTPDHPPPALDAAAIANLIRQEVDRNNAYLTFAQEQINKDRNFYKYLYSYTGGFIALLILVAGMFTYNSVGQMRTDIRESVAAELERNRAEIAALRAQATAGTAEAQATVNRELAGVRTEVQKRIDTEFQSDNITALVQKAAKERTGTELAQDIRIEAAEQVAKGIREEHPFIQKTVEDQTRATVKTLEPTIGSLVKTATEDQVNKAVSPIQAKMATYEDYLQFGTLVNLANGGDRNAFFTLKETTEGKRKESFNRDFVNMANQVGMSIISAKESGLIVPRRFKTLQTPESLKQFMRSASPWERQAAVDSYPQDDKSILPTIVDMIRSDPSIDVLVSAVRRFDLLTNQEFHFFQTTELLTWWDRNSKSFEQPVPHK